jgi:hypothetical protein
VGWPRRAPSAASWCDGGRRHRDRRGRERRRRYRRVRDQRHWGGRVRRDPRRAVVGWSAQGGTHEHDADRLGRRTAVAGQGAAAEENDARRKQLDALEQELHRRFATFRVPVDSPAWQDLVARRDQARRDVAAAREAAEAAADQWLAHILRGA